MDNSDPNFLFLERKLPPSKTNSRSSILSRRSSGRVTPEHGLGSALDIQTASASMLSVNSSEDFSSPAAARKLSGIEVNPLYDSEKRRKSSGKGIKNYLDNSMSSLDLSPKRHTRNPITGTNKKGDDKLVDYWCEPQFLCSLHYLTLSLSLSFTHYL